jgi:hypothetical protein
MEAIIAKLSEDWPVFSMMALILLNLFRSQIGQLLPKTIQDYFGAKAKMKADEQEHQQAIAETEMNLAKFKELSQLSSLSFTEEQLTQLTAETQVQLNEANSFVRGIVNSKLDMVLEKINGLKTVLYEIKDIQTFILREINNTTDENKAE